MSDISIPGLSSKYNTNKLVDDLVAAERIRLTRMEEQVTELEESRKTWRQLNRNFGDIQRSAKSLYGFENPFSERIASSSNDRILTATAGRSAPFDSYSVTVRQIATADRFLTPSLDRNFRVDSGNYVFRVGDQSVSLRYRGGSLDDFARRLNEKGEGLVRASTVRDTVDSQVLMIEAVSTGAKNRLVFEGDARKLGIETNMLRESKQNQREVSVAAAFGNARTTGDLPVPQGSLMLNDETVRVQPGGSFRIPFEPSFGPEADMVLEYSYRTIDYEVEDLRPLSPPGPVWPDVPSGSYEGLIVRSAPNSFALPDGGTWEPPPRVEDANVLSIRGSSGKQSLPAILPSPEFRTVQIPADQLPSDITSLDLDNRNSYRAIEISTIRFYNPNRQGDLEPTNPVGTAGDAIIEFRGIEARRPTNSIDDLVDGLTIELKRASDEPVELNVQPDTETAKEGVIRFVFAYNQLLTRIMVLTNDDPAVIDELEYLSDDEREDMESQLGRMRGDISLNQVKNRLQTIVSSPYATRAGSEIALLAQIGVSTNASSGNTGGSLNFSKLRGYLEINEEKLDAALNSNIEAVKDLFGRDTSGDLIIDSGAAQAIDRYLTPYTQTGGFVSTRLAGLERQIEDKQEDISDYEEHLEDFEADLKRQYGNMEGMLNQLERSSQELDNFSRQQSGNR